VSDAVEACWTVKPFNENSEFPTPTESGIPLNNASFASLTEALDYAAEGESGFNFYNGRGDLWITLPYRELRERARALALRLSRFGRGERVALVAHTHPEFAVMFYACQYAGLVPVPLAAAVHLGGRQAYVRHLRQLITDCDAVAAFAPQDFVSFLEEATEGRDMAMVGNLAAFMALEPDTQLPEPPRPSELAYLQYTSGSTRFPRGTMITHASVMANLHGIFNFGFPLTPTDRFCSWLPFYHDMGLVGIVLGCVATQRSVDYLPTREFAMRPRVWLKLLSRNRSTISFSPPFGYALCSRRLRPADTEALDLSAWRVAGVGAEMIHPEWLQQFAEILAPSGFKASAFLPCYGMAECALAVSFAELGTGAHSDPVDANHLSTAHVALPIEEARAAGLDVRENAYIDCGPPLPGYEVEIRDEQGQPLGDRQCGRIFLRGPSVMSGYFGNAEATRDALSEDGWLNTGDLGYRVNGSMYIAGRAKDLMIIKGRNIWPQDIEYLAEQQPEIRPTDTSAFSVVGADGAETAVLVVQCRATEPRILADLAERLQQEISAEFGIQCLVELVPPHTLPRTSSGKLSRSTAAKEFLQRHSEERLRESPGYLVSEELISDRRKPQDQTASQE